MTKVAVFDIGSNAIRMMVAQFPGKLEKHASDDYQILNRHRVPFRLGHDVFTHGRFSEKTLKRARQIFQGLVILAKKEGATRMEAVATSAMRESANAKELIDSVKDKCQLNIRIITGEQEAYYLFTAVRQQFKQHQGAMAMIDIGGGSTEISLVNEGKLLLSKSFSIGTIRMLEAKSQKELHHLFEYYHQGVLNLHQSVAPLIKNTRHMVMVGTGGNLRRFGKMRPQFFRSDDTSVVTLAELQFMQQEMRKYTAKELQKHYNLKRDRSQTIRPAMSLASTAMEVMGCKRMELPNVGLTDGILLEIKSHLG